MFSRLHTCSDPPAPPVVHTSLPLRRHTSTPPLQGFFPLHLVLLVNRASVMDLCCAEHHRGSYYLSLLDQVTVTCTISFRFYRSRNCRSASWIRIISAPGGPGDGQWLRLTDTVYQHPPQTPCPRASPFLRTLVLELRLHAHSRQVPSVVAGSAKPVKAAGS